MSAFGLFRICAVLGIGYVLYEFTQMGGLLDESLFLVVSQWVVNRSTFN
jgi:hypothetical protein